MTGVIHYVNLSQKYFTKKFWCVTTVEIPIFSANDLVVPTPSPYWPRISGSTDKAHVITIFVAAARQCMEILEHCANAFITYKVQIKISDRSSIISQNFQFRFVDHMVNNVQPFSTPEEIPVFFSMYLSNPTSVCQLLPIIPCKQNKNFLGNEQCNEIHSQNMCANWLNIAVQENVIRLQPLYCRKNTQIIQKP